jgi:hypothetical protein
LMSKGENLCIKAYLNLRGKLILMGDVLALPSVIFICFLQCCVSAAMNYLASIVQ